MHFNSVSFALFLPIVFILYWSLKNKDLKFQNILLLIAGYFFYACWNRMFLLLLVFSTVLDYIAGIKIEDAKNPRVKKRWLWLSIFINLGLLGVFKYYNFFIDSFEEALSHFGLNAHPWTLSIILPLGISFYTFHGISYLIDIYKDKIKSEKNIVNYAVFVSFFPLLVSGPIERATHLLPQIQTKRIFNRLKITDGLRQMLWGFFMKLVIADNCAEYANLAFNNPDSGSGSTLIIGAVFFAFQIYADFSGYSNIAIGTARLFGIELLRNFAFPYFSRSIAEFWRRWHISLSSWFRDYLYIPLGGSKAGKLITIRNIFIVFLTSGLWHGSNWTFVTWGLLHALFILPSVLFKTNRNNLNTVANGRFFPTLKELFSIFITFGLTTFAWIFFRAENLSVAWAYISEIFSGSLFSTPQIPVTLLSISTVILTLLFLLIEWIGREQKYALEKIGLTWPALYRYAFYYGLILCIILFRVSDEHPFIYFQF